MELRIIAIATIAITIAYLVFINSIPHFDLLKA